MKNHKNPKQNPFSHGLFLVFQGFNAGPSFEQNPESQQERSLIWRHSPTRSGGGFVALSVGPKS